MVTSNSGKFGQYSQVGISTSNQEMLILKCYNGVLGCLRAAKGTMGDPKRREETNANMVKAQKGLALLADSVNNNDSGEISGNLLQLYDFLIRYLVEANIKKNTDMIDEALEMVLDLKVSWEKAFAKLRAQGAPTQMLNRPVRQNILNIVG